MAAKTKISKDHKVEQILALLQKHYPDARCHLNFKNALELLIGTILAAQCTDALINLVTPSLFRKYPNAKAFADADEETLQDEIRSTGFFRNKAKSIRHCCQALVAQYGGEVPSDMKSLSALSGVGRKTANVVLGNYYGKPAIIVDTHMLRVAQRLGLTKETDPTRMEMSLLKIIPDKQQTLFSNRIGEHGRTICQARKPKCEECFLKDLCTFYAKKS